MEPPLISGKNWFSQSRKLRDFSQIFPRSLLGKHRTTIYRVSTPESHDIVGLFSRSVSSSGKPGRFSHKSTHVSKCLIQSGTILSTPTHLYDFQTYFTSHLV